MERLTKYKFGNIVSEKQEKAGIHCSNFCNNCSQGTGNCKHLKAMVDKLATYEDAEEKGLLLKLPIDEITPVYSIEYCCGESPDYKVGMCVRGFCGDCDSKSYYIKNGTAKQCTLSEIGKTVFLTQEQAEEALKKMGETEGK